MSTEAQRQAVRSIYAEGLGFEPTDVMVAEAVDSLSPGSMPSSSLFSSWLMFADPLEVAKAVRADEHMQLADPVTWAFRHYLGRDPEQGGLDYYTAQIADGRPEWQVIREIAESPEAQSE